MVATYVFLFSFSIWLDDFPSLFSTQAVHVHVTAYVYPQKSSTCDITLTKVRSLFSVEKFGYCDIIFLSTYMYIPYLLD